MARKISLFINPSASYSCYKPTLQVAKFIYCGGEAAAEAPTSGFNRILVEKGINI